VPLVQCLTNLVVTGFTANSLLAVGASPAMVDEADEAAELAKAADALLVNVGTPSEASAASMRAAAQAAHASGTPWVLDPVAVGPLTFRTRLATDLLGRGPAVVRGNPSEVLSLAGATGSARGVDSAADAASALSTAFDLARREETTVAISGAVDYVTDGRQVVEVRTGDPLMTRVTGVGCVLGALVAACAAVEESPLLAASPPTAVLTVAAEVAAENSAGPGTFAVALLDALYRLDAGTLESHLQARSR
jgi:hydroxyethylthiazole kinase